MKKLRGLLAIALAISMMFSLIACSAPSDGADSSNTPDTGTDAEASNGDTIKFGVIFSLTGDAAANHTIARSGMELACEEINAAGGVLGKQIELQFEDEQSTPDGCITVASKLYADPDVVAILGPNRTAHTTALKEKIINGKKPIICWSTSPTVTGNNFSEWLFFARPSDLVSAAASAQYMVDEGAKKVGIFYVNDDFGEGCRTVLEDTLDNLGVEYVSLGHNAGDKDFQGQILQLKAEGCDWVSPWGHTAEMAIFVRQAYENGLGVPIMGSVSITESNVSDLLDAKMLENVYSVCDTPTADAADPMMKELYEKAIATGVVPNVLYSSAYSTLYMICHAIEEAGATDAQSIADALRAADGSFKTPAGAMICTDQQVLTKTLSLMKYNENKELVTLGVID